MTAGEIPEGVAILWGVDPIGLLCEPCYARGRPPHYDYLREIRRALPLHGENIMEAIAKYAYPDYEAVVRDV